MNSSRRDNAGVRSLYEIDPSKLSAGKALPGNILSSRGQVLFKAGQLLEAQHLTSLLKHRSKGIFAEGDWAVPYACPTFKATGKSDSFRSREGKRASSAKSSRCDTEPPRISKNGLRTVSIDDLQPGTILEYGLYRPEGALLLAQGQVITPHFLDKLRAHGICTMHTAKTAPPLSVKREPPEDRRDRDEVIDPASMVSEWTDVHGKPASVRTRTTLRLDRVAQHRPDVRRASSSHREVLPRLSASALLKEIQRTQEIHACLTQQMAGVLVDVLQGKAAGVIGAREAISKLYAVSRLDVNLLSTVATPMNTEGEYLFDHALCVAALSMSVASQQGLCPDEIREIGLGALLSDVGMIGIPEEMRLAPRRLTEEERSTLNWHPFFSVDAMERAGKMSPISMVIAYQSHERQDGSGYPRAHHRMYIHPYARMVAVADVYIALRSQRPHRGGFSPYDAMTALLEEGRKGRVDREAIRALLDSVSLFPVGSDVRLSDGCIARVIRANPGLHTRPVVLPLNADGSPSDVELDLSRDETIRVIEALRDDADQTQP